ncbi:MAG: peptidoglycan-binding domain-containing protein [Pseudomonadota bacterium]
MNTRSVLMASWSSGVTLNVLMLLLASALVFSGGAPAFSKIIGKDDRISAIPFPFSRIKPSLGILSVQGAGGCTAFCVAPDIIATSAHCLLKDNGSWRKKNMRLIFSQYLSGKKSRTYMRTSNPHSIRLRVVLGTRVQALRTRTWVPTRREDWALVRFDKRLCKQVVPIRALKNLPKATKSTEIGMPSKLYLSEQAANSDTISILFSTKCTFTRSVPGMPSRYQREFRRRVGNKLNGLHTCDSQNGQSGSPILRRLEDGSVEAVAIHSGHATWCVNRKKRKTCYPFSLSAQLTTMTRALERLRTETVVDEKSLKVIQRALAKRRLYKGKIDGVFGPATRRAIHKYERSAKLAFLGLPTKQLMTKMRLKSPPPPPKPEDLLSAADWSAGLIRTSADGSIIGDDNRTQKVRIAAADAVGGVGTLAYSSSFCSGFCVADNVVATDAACLVNDKGKWRNSWNNFRFLLNSGGRPAWSRVLGNDGLTRSRNIALGRLNARTPATGFRLGVRDWALFRVARDVCKKTLQLADKQSGEPGPVVMLSAHAKEAVTPTLPSALFSDACALVSSIPQLQSPARQKVERLAKDSGRILHTCDSTADQSGSPILQIRPNGTLVVHGINSGKVTWEHSPKTGQRVQFSANAAVPSQAVAASLRRFQEEDVLSYTKYVQQLQKALQGRKLHTGRTDGIFDLETRRAILQLEDERKLPLLGLPTRRILELLTQN